LLSNLNQMLIGETEFLTILRENGGLYAKTAKAITELTGVSISRQAVYQRAQNYPEILKDIKEEIIDGAEDGLADLMKCDDNRIKLEAIKLYLKTQAKSRGYVEKQEVDLSGSININWEEKRTYVGNNPSI
jgi:hypothetical protein